MTLVAGCSSGPARPHADGHTTTKKNSPVVSTLGSPVPVPSTVERWGSFFGGSQAGNFGIKFSPVPVTLPGTVAEVGSSNSSEYALLTDGRLYAWGLGTQGQLGNGRWASSLTKPVQVRFPAGVRIASIPTDAMPYDSGLAVDTHGNVWGWGDNGGGELCLGSAAAYGEPVKLPLSHVTALAGASNHAVYDSNGTVYACGQNVSGDLGDGSSDGTMTPKPVAGLAGQTVVKLVASYANSGALLSDGKYYDWGMDRAGQLGDGHLRRSVNVPVLAKLPGPVAQVAQGGSLWNNGQTLVLLADGSLWAWGNDRYGQLGDRSIKPRATPERFHSPDGVTYQSLATGSMTSYAISVDGDVYAWGVSHVGQLGNGQHTRSQGPQFVVTGATSISATANNVVINVPNSDS